MEAVITYIKGYPNKTKLTYRRDDVVARIVAQWEWKNNKVQKAIHNK
jgi:hypothetical protein